MPGPVPQWDSLALSPRPRPSMQEMLDLAALATTPVPVVGDVAGLASDGYRFATDPSSRTVGNAAWASLGLLPFMPAMGAVTRAAKELPMEVILDTDRGRPLLRVMGLPTEVEHGGQGWMQFGLDGNEIARGRDWITKPSEAAASDAQKKIADILAKNPDLAEWQAPRYGRFGDLPPKGISKNFATGAPEKGVSAIEMRKNLEDGGINLVPYGSPSFLWVQDRPFYELSGQKIGLGSDGEPILKDAKVVREIPREQLRRSK